MNTSRWLRTGAVIKTLQTNFWRAAVHKRLSTAGFYVNRGLGDSWWGAAEHMRALKRGQILLPGSLQSADALQVQVM